MDPTVSFKSNGTICRETIFVIFQHIKLPDSRDRNVTLYLHIAALPKKMYVKKRKKEEMKHQMKEYTERHILRDSYV